MQLTKVHTVLILCPLSLVHNWIDEFKKWLIDTVRVCFYLFLYLYLVVENSFCEKCYSVLRRNCVLLSFKHCQLSYMCGIG
jgi:SNF2 family DNA or RNA helicase